MLNIVSTVTICTLDQKLDLQKLSTKIDGAILPKKGGSLVKFRMKPENYYIAFYKTGKILITGIKSLEEINCTAQKILKILAKAGIVIQIVKIEIVNIVCLGAIHLNKTLECVVGILDSSDVSYEPEQFPGLIYKNWGATFLLFSSGKVVLTGIKDLENANRLLEKFEKSIQN